MDVKLDQGRVPNTAEAVDLSGLDDEYVTCAGLEFLSVDGPQTAAFPDELDFIVGMSMGPGATARERAEKKHGDIHVAVISANELVRAALKREVLLTDAVHPADTLLEVIAAKAATADRLSASTTHC